MEILGRMNRFQGPRWPTQASEGRSSKLVGGWGEAENEKRQGPGHIGPLCVLWGLESALSGPPCLSPPDTCAVFNTEEFCDLWLLLYVKVQPKTSQTYGFCLCVTCGPSPQAATPASGLLGPLLKAARCVHQGSQHRNVWISAAARSFS